jgi:hypothetical protein
VEKMHDKNEDDVDEKKKMSDRLLLPGADWIDYPTRTSTRR